ncbi:MAG TPA: VWA domain-containing protein, partial [Thermoanaerobaculia bacterium]|nr:VWA domain-containing protein [Thermoanaerobaculia bacterium]
MKTRTYGFLVAVLLVAVAAFAQQQPYFQTFEVRLHNLEVQVTDAEGKPVRGLSREDFIVLENGIDQDVTNFAVYDSTTSTRLAPRTDGAQSPSVQEGELPPPRRFVFFVDDMSLRKPVRKALIDNANALLDQLQPGDLAAVVRPDGRDRMPQPFTADTEAARKVLAETIESCKLGFTDFDEYTRNSMNAFAVLDARRGQTLYAYRTGKQVQQRLAQLRALIGSMAGIEGRKVVVLLTDGLPSIPSRVGINPLDQMGLDD